MAQNLSFEVRGDCTSAIAALSNTESAISHLAGMDAGFSVSVTGASSAISQLERVGSAARAASGDVSVSADTRSLDSAQKTVAALRGEIRGMDRDMSQVGGLDVGVSGGGDVREMAGLLRGLGGAFNAASAGMDSFADSGGRASGVGGQIASGMSGATRAMQDHTAAVQDHVSAVEAQRAAVQGFTSDQRELASVGAAVQDAVRTGGTPGGMAQPSRASAPIGYSARGYGAFPSPPPGTPGPPSGGGGGRGGPPGGSGGTPRGGGGGDDGGFGGFNNMLMLPAVGAMEPLITGLGGLMAVKETIKNVPQLAAAQKVAMLDFKEGIYQAAQAASGVGVPEILALGNTLHGLGTEIGTMGAEHLSTALSGINAMAGQATQALKALDPAMESSMNAVFGVTGALLSGVANPALAAAIKTTAGAIGDVTNDKGFANLVSAVGTVAATAATPAANVLGLGGNLLGLFGAEGEGPAAAAGLGGFLGSKMLSRGAAAALKSGKPEIGKFAAGLTGAGIFAQAAQDEQAGVDPTAGMAGGIGGAVLGKALGAGGPGMMFMAAVGEMLAHDPAVVGGGDPSGRTSTAPGGAFAAPAPPPGARSGTPFSPDTGGIHDKAGGWRDETMLGKALDFLGVSRSLSGPTGPRPDWQRDSALGQEADKEFAAGKDPMANAFGAGPKEPSAASPEGIQKKAAAAQAASAADPTNLGLAQQAAFAKAVADERRKSKGLDDPMAAFMAAGPGGGGGGGGQIVGAQGAGTWTWGGGGVGGGYGGGGAVSGGVPSGGAAAPIAPSAGGGAPPGPPTGGGGGGGVPPPVIPSGGQGLEVLRPGMAAALGLGPGTRGAGTGAGGDVPPGAGTPGGSATLGGADPRPTGGMSTDNRVTLSSGWGPGGQFSAGGAPQILSSLTDLRTTASSMFGAMGGLPSGPDAAALRRDWAATRDTAGGTTPDRYADASRFLGSDIQRASQSIWDKGPAAVDAYTTALADQQMPGWRVTEAARTAQGTAAGGGTTAGVGAGPTTFDGGGGFTFGGDPDAAAAYAAAQPRLPLDVLGERSGQVGAGAPGALPGFEAPPAAPAAVPPGEAGARGPSSFLGDLFRGPLGTPGPPTAPSPPMAARYPQGAFGGPTPRPGGPPGEGGARGPSNLVGDLFKGPLGAGSAGPAGAAQLQRLNAALTTQDSRAAQTTQTNHALAQSLQQVSKGGEMAQQSARPMEGMNNSIGGVASGAGQAAQSVGGLSDALKGANAAAIGGGGPGGLGAAVAGGMDTGLAGFSASVGTGASAAGRTAGEATASAMASGMAQASAKVGNEAGAMGSIAANSASLALKVKSPSRVFYDIGQSTGDGMTLGVVGSMPAVGAAVGGGLRGITDAARGVANDNGLMVGFSYVESITTGVEQATKMSGFQQLGMPQIKSAAAKAALGLAGLMGPAGSGAQSYKLESQEVSFGAGSPAVPAVTPVTLYVNLDGAPFHQMVVTANNAMLNELTNRISRQRGS